MTQKEYYKTTITVEVLSEGVYDPDTIHDIAHDITEGDCSGEWNVTDQEQVTAEEMAKLLREQASDASFLLGDDWSEEE